MTIYRLYADNGNRAGFWVQHRSWQNTCALVQSVAGQREGRLPGTAPRHDDAAVNVRGFDVRSGRPIDLGPTLEAPHDRHYVAIARPWWYHTSQEIVRPDRVSH
jgi:hypothetical protein